MSLGVLNNLSAMYAANNLNNTSNSLNTVLQQLSSGSKINSGADDAAGLSLVNGLQANSMALAQSQTNAAEGVGLLKVADGALSQVTNLLNRAVTLATEASNGTLNSSQDAAANSEYQSILSEISNIGATTTYNNQTVFGSAQPVNIYTGDSSTAGASVTALNIGALSSSNVGDTGGVMSYSNGSNNVFLNLSSSTANAATTDYLNGGATGQTDLKVTYAVKGGNGTSTTATATITAGGVSGYQNTAQGMISAINNSGLGLTATFATQSKAGVQGGGSQTGIEITGGLISAGVDPSGSSTSGTLNLSGLAAGATLALGSTLQITDGSTTYGKITIDASNDTLKTLATAIGTNTNNAVSASVITNGDGTQSLALSDVAGGGALSVVTGGGTAQTLASAFAAGGTGTIVNVQTQGTDTVGTKAVTAQASTVTIGTGAGGQLFSDQLTAGTSIQIVNSIPGNTQTQTFVIGSGTDNTPAGTHYTSNVDGGTGGNTLGTLADAINAMSNSLGIFASVASDGSGLKLTTGTWTGGNYQATGGATIVTGTPTATTGENISVGSGTNTLTSATTGTELSLYTPTIGGALGGTPTITAVNDGKGTALVGDTLTGSATFNVGATSFAYTASAGDNTYTNLINDINGSALNTKVTASWDSTNKGLLFTDVTTGVSTAVTLTGAGTFKDFTDANTAIATVTNVQPGTAGQPGDTPSTAILQLGTGVIDDTNSKLGGAINIVVQNVGNQTFIMGNDPGALNSEHVAGAIYTGGTTVTSLVNAINSFGMNGVANALAGKITASDPGIGGGAGDTGGIYLQGVAGSSNTITLGALTTTGGSSTPVVTPLAVTSTMTAGSVTKAVTGVTGVAATDSITAGVSTTISTNDIVSGSITITNGGQNVGADTGAGAAQAGSASTPTKTVLDTGAAAVAADKLTGAITFTVGGASYTYTAQAGDDWNTLLSRINASSIGTGNTNGVTATLSPNAGGAGVGGLLLTDNANGINPIAITNNSLVDQATAKTETFTVGAGHNTTTSFFTNPDNGGAQQYANDASGLAAAISAQSATLGITAQANASGLTLTQTSANGGSIVTSGNSLTDVTAGSFLNSSAVVAGQNDTLSGALVFNVAGGGNQSITMKQVTDSGQAATVQGLINYIHANSTTGQQYGIDAQWVPNTSGNLSFGTIKLISNTEGPSGGVNVSSTLTSLTDTTVNSTLSYTAGAAYTTGLSNGTNAVFDSTVNQSAATFTAQNLKGSGIATISYSDQAGQSLSTTDLTNSTSAKAALTALNAAITDVASQDGYIGAMINTLNSVSSVLATQQQNVVAAQNAVQATDYASAASNMSKYEILSQTGISALAQANSMQQEVTKLLQ